MNIRSTLQRHRWQIPAWTIALVFAAYGLVDNEPDSEEANIQPTAPLTEAIQAPPITQQADTEVKPSSPVDIFAVRTWEPPTPIKEVASVVPPPAPQAPPLPFRYSGKIEETGKAPVFFLAQGEKILAVSPGDQIKGDYLVGKIEGGQLRFLYRPMKIEQSIRIGGER